MDAKRYVLFSVAVSELLASMACGGFIDPMQDTESSAQAVGLSPSGTSLRFVNGAVAENEFGIAGLVFSAAGPGSVVEVTEVDGQLCAAGVSGRVLDGDFGRYWGVEVAFDLGPGLAGWDRGDVEGFSFVLDGDVPSSMGLHTVPAGSRLGLDRFCERFAPSSGTTIDVPLSSIRRDCWFSDGEPLPPGNLKSLVWHVPNNEFSDTRFDFCIRDVAPRLGGSR